MNYPVSVIIFVCFIWLVVKNVNLYDCGQQYDVRANRTEHGGASPGCCSPYSVGQERKQVSAGLELKTTTLVIYSCMNTLRYNNNVDSEALVYFLTFIWDDYFRPM